MRNRHIFRSVLLVLLAFSSFSCEEREDNTDDLEQIRQQLREHEEQIQALKLAVERLNQDISAIRSVLGELNTGGYVTGVSEEVREETVVGYSLSFNDGRGVYLRTSAAQEQAPSVSVRKDTDGLYYWTLNGKWLKDQYGRQIAVSDEGSSPMLRVEEGAWSISVDGGNTWTPSPSSETSAPFRSIDTSNPDYVLITLSDGTVLQLPTWSAFVALRNIVNRLNTNVASLQLILASLQDGDYLLSASPYMENGEQVGWLLNFAKSGIVIIYSGVDGKDGLTPSFKIEDGWWYISYDDGATWTRMDKATEDSSGIVIDGVDFSDEAFVTLVLSDGTTLSIPRFRPSDFIIETPESGFPIQSGETITIHFSISGSAPGNVVVTAASDGFYRPRVQMTGASEGLIYVTAPSPYVDGHIIVMLDGGNGYSTMRVLKFCQRVISLQDELVYQLDEKGGTITIPWTGNYSFTVSTDSEWIHPVSTKASLSGSIVLAVDPNPTDSPRAGVVRLHPDDNPGFTSQEIYIREGAEKADVFGPASMVLTVRASSVNNYTVYLPFHGNLDCTIDWGDGNSDSYGGSRNIDFPFHKYGVQEPATFVVTVSGKVPDIHSTDIPKRSGIVSIVHWGNLQTVSIRKGFAEITTLESVAADTDGFFSLITDCDDIFYGCTGLKDVSDGTFRSGHGITSFNRAFDSCTKLSGVPAALFEGCSGAVSFASTFERCSSLKSIPEGLFDYSPGAKIFTDTFILSGLETIPAGLFSACPDAQDFRETFRECFSLTSLPAGLFDNNRSVTDFGLTFWGCWNITG